MEPYFLINGQQPLQGKVRVSGAKNSVLALLIASTMTNDVVIFEDVPKIQDVDELISILRYLQSNVISMPKSNRNYVTIDGANLDYKDLLIEEITKFRASYYFMGAFVARFKHCRLYLPGGCHLGPRPIDLHIMGLEKLGCKINMIDEGDKTIVDISCPDGLKGNNIFLDFPSVGATINLILAASMADGETKIENAAREPEIVDVVTLLNNMGANIKGAGTDEIRIKGVKELHGCLHQVVPDRIEAGTYVMMGCLLSNDLIVDNIIPEHIEALTSKLINMGFNLDIKDESIHIKETDKSKLEGTKIKTGVFPSFPTDLQQVFLTLTTQVNGESEIIETIYPQRFKQCGDLENMGANINITLGEEQSKAIVTGKTPLVGKTVHSTDLRAGASLVLAGLIAQGETKVYAINHILRGYDNFIEKLQAIGADITLVKE